MKNSNPISSDHEKHSKPVIVPSSKASNEVNKVKGKSDHTRQTKDRNNQAPIPDAKIDKNMNFRRPVIGEDIPISNQDPW